MPRKPKEKKDTEAAVDTQPEPFDPVALAEYEDARAAELAEFEEREREEVERQQAERKKRLATPTADEAAADLEKLAHAAAKIVPTQPLPLDELAARCDATAADLARVFDEFKLQGGKPVHVGPGQGGGWVPHPEPAERRRRRVPLTDMPPEIQLEAIDRMYDNVAISADQRDRLKERAQKQLAAS